MSIDRRTEARGPPLIYAAGRDDPKMVKLLLHRGVNVNNTDGSGNTALIAAASNNVRLRSFDFLLSTGAAVDRSTRKPYPAIQP